MGRTIVIVEHATVELVTDPEGPDDALVVAIAGELDPNTADAIRDQVRQLAGDQRAPELVLDLSKVTFMDSAGVRVIVELHHDRQRAGGRLILVNIADSPRRVLDLSGLTAELGRA